MIAAAVQSLLNLWLANPVGQTIGLVASLCFIFAAVQHRDRRLIAAQLTGTALFILHYSTLGAWTAVGSFSIGFLRNIIAYFYRITPARRMWMAVVFLAAYIGLAFWVIKQWLDISPLLGGVLITFAFFNYTGVRMRLYIMAAQVLYLIYAIWVGSIGGSIDEIIEFLLTGFTVMRLLRPEASRPQTQ